LPLASGIIASDVVNVSNNSGTSGGPDIAVDSAGHVHVVWFDDTPGNYEILYSQWNGETWLLPVVVSNNPTASEWPAVAVDSDGVIHVVWQDWTTSYNEILYRRSTDGGQTWSPAHNLSNSTYYSYHPRIVGATDGRLHVVWDEVVSHGSFWGYEIYHRMSADGGQNWSGVTNLSSAVGTTHSGYADMAAGMGGDVHVVWWATNSSYVGGEVYYRRWDSSNEVWTGLEQVSDGEMKSSYPRIAADDENNGHAVWHYDDTPNGDGYGDVYYRKRGSTGWLGDPTLLSDGDEEMWDYPDVAAGAADNVYVVWPDTGLAGTYYRRWDGSSWSPAEAIFDSGVTIWTVAVAADEVGNGHVVRASIDPPATAYDVYYLELSPSGLWVDVSVSPGTTLTLTGEGWPTPNPLEVTVTVGNNTTTTVDVSGTLTLGSTPPPRFYIIADDEGNAGEDFSQTTYLDDFTVNLTPFSTQMFTWTVWVQPSEATTLQATAELNVAGTPQDTTNVTIPQASIHPVVFLHGILGSMPPKNSVITQWPQNLFGSPMTEGYLDPFTDSYVPLIENLMKMGYELDKTLFPVTYDWRQSNQKSASYLGWVLDERIPNRVNAVSYAVQDGQADVIVRSMGGIVLRTYLEDLADDPQYRGLDHVNKAVFIASPHRGFPITYRTWEGLTWEEYLNKEIDPVSNAVPPGFYHWITSTFSIELPFRINTLHLAMDNLLWPYMILKRYEPQAYEPCWLPDPDIPLVPELVEHNLSLLVASTECHLLAWPALHTFSHDPIWGIRSLPEMLPEVGVSPPYLQGWAPLPLPPGTKEYPWCGTWHGIPNPCSPDGRQTNPLLETHGLNDPASVSTFVSHVGDQNIYVLYNSEEPTPYTYDDLLVPVRTPEYDVDVPFTDPTITWHISSIDLWPNGWPRLRHATLGDGDNLIPDYSTRLHYGGLVTLPDPDNQELLIDTDGHKRIVLAEKAQSGIGAILTGYLSPYDAVRYRSFPLITPYTPPRFLVDNGDVILVFLVWSPADVLVTDPLGRSVGYDPATGQIVNEIPGAFYTGNGSDEEFVIIPGDLEGDYTVTASGTGTGLYAISAHRVDGTGVQDIGIVSGTIAPGQVVSGTVAWTPETDAIFEDDMESGGGNWVAAGGWTLTTGDAHSPVTAWAGQPITPGMPLTLTLQVPLDLSVARWARLTFWYSQALSTEAAGVVELSVDGGEHWTAVAAHTGETGEWRRRTLDLTPFTEPGLPPLRLRFRLFPAASDDRWLIDDLRVEALPAPSLFGLPFEDDVEGWRKWNAAGSWVRTRDAAHSDHLAWQSDAPGAVLTLAGALDLWEAVSPTLTFWYTMTTGGEGVVEVSTDGTAWQPAATITPTTEWTQASADLSAWAGLTATLRLRQTAGATWTVDDFAVRDVVPPVVHPLPFDDNMEEPEANWRAVNAWEPVTTTAHSGTSAWRGYASDSALILVDRLDLSEAVSPTLTFWQRFVLAEGSVGQVMASPDGGLTWQPVLTVTNPISAWTQVEVDLSAYAEQEVGLAFYLSEVATGTVGGQAGYIGEPGYAAGYTQSPDSDGQARGSSGIAVPLLALSLLAAPVLVVMGRRCQSRTDRRWAWVMLAGLAVACGPCNCLNIGYNVPANPYPGENRLDDVLGEVEPIVLAEREPMAASLSPDGKWMLVLIRETGPVLAIDLEHNQEYEILSDGGTTARWLDDNHAFLRRGIILRVPDIEMWQVERLSFPDPAPTDIDVLRDAKFVYVLVGWPSSVPVLVTADPSVPYEVAVNWSVEEVEAHLAGIPHTIIQAGGLPFDYNSRHYSPDGQYYVAPRPVNVPGDSLDYPLIAMFDAATEKEVAHAFKWGWHGDFRGWAYDNSGAYFIYKPWGVDADVLHPRHPIYKLLVPGATPRGTPVPVSTPTPSSEGRVPGVGQLRPVGYRPAPVAQSGEQGWYVDDVSVFDAASSPYIFHDDFNRPDSSDLGPDWVEEEGEWDIVDEQLHAQVNGAYAVGTTDSFSETVYTLEARFRATGNLNQWYNAIALGFGGTEEGIDSTGYSVAYIPAWGKLKLTREYKFLDYASVTLIPGQWYQLKVVRNGATGSIEVYLDQGQGYPETPTLEAVDSTYPDLRRLGWAAGGSGYALEVEWIIAVEGGAP